MASGMDKILEMSLDEYIATRRKNLRKDILNRMNGVNTTDTAFNEQFESKFKAERRATKREEEAEEDDDEMLDLSTNQHCMADQILHESDRLATKSIGIWSGPSAETKYLDLDCMKDECDSMFNELEQQPKNEQKPLQKSLSTVDLRSRLNNSNSNNNGSSKNSVNDVQSSLAKTKRNIDNQKWRRPSDCIPNRQQPQRQQQQKQQRLQHSVSLGNINTNNGNYQNRRRYNRNSFRRRNGGGCGGNGNGQNWNWNWSNNRNHGGGGGGGCGNANSNLNNLLNFNNRIQRPNQRNNQDMLNKNIKAVLERINSNNVYVNRHGNAARDITIECANTALNQIPMAQATQPQTSGSTHADVKALLGVNDNSLKTEAIPMLAAKFLDFLQNGAPQTMHKPIYDMQVQKKIHDLQGKPLTYKCPSGEVVSSDGGGIDNCEITPSTSGLTLNYRFG